MTNVNEDFDSMVYKFFDKKASDRDIKNENIWNQELSEKLQKPIVRKLEKRKVHSYFIDNIWSSDITDMQLINMQVV